MGLILDTNILVRAERKRLDLAQCLETVNSFSGESKFAISVITLTELAHGEFREIYPSVQRYRTQFLQDLVDSVSVYEVDVSIALRAGRLDGLLAEKGVAIGISDLLIAATAVANGFGVLTANSKHFFPVPTLRVVDATALQYP